METTFIFGINLLLLFRQPCVQFSLQAARPQKDYARNIGIVRDAIGAFKERFLTNPHLFTRLSKSMQRVLSMYHVFQLIRLFKESCRQTFNQAFRIFDTITGNEAIERQISF